MQTLNQPEKPETVSRSEYRWVWLFSAAVLLVTTIPYLLGFAIQGASWRFSGFVFGVEDGNSYIAKMLIGGSGGWLFRTPYTAYEQTGVVAFLPYILLGKLSAPPGQHDQLVALFHLFRIAAGILVIRASYDLIAYYLQEVWRRKFALGLVILGGGLGWLMVLLGKSQWLGSLPLDFYSPETFGFLGIYGIPHLALARAGLLWGLLAYLRATTGDRHTQNRQILILGVWWLIVAFAQPLTAVVMGFVLGLHLLALGLIRVGFWRKNRAGGLTDWLRNARIAFLAGLIPLPFLLYTFLSFTLDPFLREWTSQNIITSPHPLHYLIAYALVIPPTYIGSKILLARRQFAGLMLVAWVLALPVLAYAPYNLQRRLPEGIWVALVILAVAGLSREGRNLRNLWRNLLLLAFPSTLILLIGGWTAVREPALPVFRPAREVEAFEYLSGHVTSREIVLTSYSSGNALPAWAPVQVIIGHGPESIHLSELNPAIQKFFSSGTAIEAKADLLDEFNIKYVFWGPEERQLGDWDPEAAANLVNIFANEEYQVFQVLKSDE